MEPCPTHPYYRATVYVPSLAHEIPAHGPGVVTMTDSGVRHATVWLYLIFLSGGHVADNDGQQQASQKTRYDLGQVVKL